MSEIIWYLFSPHDLFNLEYFQGLSMLLFPGGSVLKNPPANARDMGSIPRLGKYPVEGNGNLL